MQLSHHRNYLSNLAYKETVAWYFWLFGCLWSQRDIKLSNNIPQALENDDTWGDTLRGPKIFLALYCLERSKGNWPQRRQSPKLFLKSSEVGLPQPLPRWRVCPPPPITGGRHTRQRERGWESPNSDEVTYTVVFFIYRYLMELTIVRVHVASKMLILKALYLW
jgi:hypothetical protein